MHPIDSSPRHARLAQQMPPAPGDDGATGTAMPAQGVPTLTVVPAAMILASAACANPLLSRTTVAGDLVAALPPPAAGALSADAGAALQRALSANADTGTVSVDVTQLMALMTKFAQEVRTARSAERTQALNTQMLSLSQSAQDIRDAAAKNYDAAIVQGALQIGGGALQGAGAAVSLRSTAAAVDAGLTSGPGVMLSARAGTQQAMGRALSEGLSGVGTIASGSLVREAKNDEATQAQDEAAAKRSETIAGTAGDAVSKMDQVIASLRDSSRTMNQARSDTAAAVIRNV